MIILNDIIQGTPEWHMARIGSIGGSGITTAVSNGTGRGKFMLQKAGEILSRTPSDDFDTWQFKRGRRYEPEARIYYEQMFQIDVEQVGLIKESEFKHFSPDGLIGEDGFIEIKIRIPSVFLEILDGKNIATGERRQIQWGHKIMHRKWCDHIDYCPELCEPGLISPIYIQRVYPDENEINELNMKCDKFIGEMLVLIRKVKKGA